MNIFVGNLSTQATEKQIENLFIPFGKVSSVKIITDPYTKRSKGFAFVTMPAQQEGEKAIEKLKYTSLHLQTLVINEARPKNDNDRFGHSRY